MRITLLLFIFCISVSSFSSQNSGGTWATGVAYQDISIVREHHKLNIKLNAMGSGETCQKQIVYNNSCDVFKYPNQEEIM